MPDTIYHTNEQSEPYKPQKENFYVYLLCNPIKDDQPFYVGKGKDKRAFRHVGATDTSEHAKQNPHRHNTVKKIRRSGLEPNLYCLWEGDSEESAFWVEKYFIAMFGRKVDGGSLCNITKGGDGLSGYIPSQETRAKLSAAHIGRRHSPEARERISSTQIGKKVSLETRERLRVAHIGNKPSQETRAKMSAAQTGRTHTPETRAKISAGHIGKKLTPEHIAQMSAARIGKKLSPEHRAKMSAVRTGRKHTAESKAKMAEIRSKLWLVTFPDGHHEHLRNLAVLARQNNLDRTALRKGGTSKGFKAQRLPDE